MSRIAVQGDPGGLGIVTVKAPNTEDSYALELPPSGGTLARAAAGGMPLLDDGTPVVESGSNSDGEWTRWAEGTQVASSSLAPASNNNSGTSFLYPVPFLSTPSKTALTTSIGSGGVGGSYVVEVSTGNSTGATAKALLHQASQITDAPSVVITVVSYGRWK